MQPKACAIMLALAALSPAAQLKTETLNAWNAYIARENATVRARAGNQEGFFWVDGTPDRRNQVRSGQVVVAPFSEPNPKRVPGGLIHHWIGAEFIPKATIQDVLMITRDYAGYKIYYKPGIADAKLTSKTEFKDEYNIRYVSSSMLSKTSLIASYITEFVRVNDKRWYNTSQTTQVCDVQDFGRANEKRFPPGQGSGYIWQTYGTARLEERDGGVLVEMEAIVLSRDIPAALQWIVDPIVRRLSRNSLEESLTQTSTAVRERACK